MLPAMRFERLWALLCEEGNDGLPCAPFCDAAYSCHGNAGDGAGLTGGGRSGEEQFVILAAVQSLVESCCRVDGQQSRIDLGGHAGFFAEMGEIGGEAVAQVDGGGG